jgi:hypothetical protein
MNEVTTERFTVGVFQDVAWARRGLEALAQHGFEVEALSLLARETPEVAALVQEVFGREPRRLEVRGLGAVFACGPLIEALEGEGRDLGRAGLAAAMRRVGFQGHDGYIYERLVERGGVLVAVREEPRAADALAVLHCYGGGNAAIGAWRGRV